MKDSQEFKPHKIMPILTIEQLVASHLVAEILIDIRKDLQERNEKSIEFTAPELEVKGSNQISPRAQELFLKAFSIMKMKPSYVLMAKIGIEDIFNYNFKDSSSVTTAGTADTAHLSTMVGSQFLDLGEIDLEEHTLNVLEQAITVAEETGRAASMSMAILGSLFHDFGKSQEIRKTVMGEGMQRGVKAHAEISGTYIKEMLLTRVLSVMEETQILTDAGDRLMNIVKNHHPANKDQREDLEIAFIVKADAQARKAEMSKIRRKRLESKSK